MSTIYDIKYTTKYQMFLTNTTELSYAVLYHYQNCIHHNPHKS